VEPGAGGEGGSSTGAEGGAGAVPSCAVGDERACREAGLLGPCAAGTQTCRAEDNWSACTIAPAASDGCEPGDDADCDGTPNEGCTCVDGDVQTCGDVPEHGRCALGASTCVEGTWGPCEGVLAPAIRDCSSAEDNDCDGLADETLDDACLCVPGATERCDAHPGLDGVGACAAGARACLPLRDGSRSDWGLCEGSVGPSAERCDGVLDEDCDGEVDEGCSGIGGAGGAATGGTGGQATGGATTGGVETGGAGTGGLATGGASTGGAETGGVGTGGQATGGVSTGGVVTGGTGGDVQSCTDPAPTGIAATYMTPQTCDETSLLNPILQLVNPGGASVPLELLTIRYWFTTDAVTEVVFDCYFAMVGCNSLTSTFGPDYLEICFLASAGELGTSTDELDFGIHSPSYEQMFSQANDYSFDPEAISAATSSRITVYFCGELIWGVEPSSG